MLYFFLDFDAPKEVVVFRDFRGFKCDIFMLAGVIITLFRSEVVKASHNGNDGNSTFDVIIRAVRIY